MNNLQPLNFVMLIIILFLALSGFSFSLLARLQFGGND